MKQHVERYLTALNHGKPVTVKISTDGKWMRAYATVRGITYGYNGHKGSSTIKLINGLKDFIKHDL